MENEREQIERLITNLAEISTFLVKIKHRLENEKPVRISEAVERFLDGFNNSPLHGDPPVPMHDVDASKLNIKQVKKGVSFSEEEIRKMLIDIPGISISKKQRRDGRYQGYITLKGEKYYVYGRTRSDVAVKIQAILKYGVAKRRRPPSQVNGIPQTFDAFATYYFEKFRQKRLAKRTYDSDMSRYRNHLKPFFKNKPLKRITPAECQDVIDKLVSEGKFKTAEEIHSLLSIIFKAAILHNVITKNPLNVVYLEKYERQHGSALSSEEITSLKNTLSDTAFMQPFMILLYTGLRPNELPSVRIDGEFIVAINSKRKSKTVEYKKIPITPMLKPFLAEPLNLSSPDYLRRKMREVMPTHKLYDLRTTFYSKCKECGVSEPALNHFVGHSNGVLGNTYTKLSDEYLLKEGEKIRF
ncbi:MAG: hypothetical protein E7369_02595 [Clostridiales bacterium]|nr:hypothetical protein [Clostridiales bacterium]